MFARLASRTGVAAVVAALALAASAGSARAETVNFTGSTPNNPTGNSANDGVSFGGSMTLGPVTTVGGTTSATLSVTLRNTTNTTYPGSDAVAHGFITGFGFNLPNNVTATAPKTGNFNFLTAAANATNLQGGEFDFAFSTNTSQLHTVTNAQILLGLAAGQSQTFTVNLTGSGLIGLTAAQIMKELSAPSNATTGAGRVPFSVRFRSKDTGIYAGEYQGTTTPDGDKVPVASVTTPPTNPIPAPPGVVLAGMGFGALLLRRLRTK